MTTKQKPQLLSLADYTDEMLALDDLAAMDDGEWTEAHQALAEELLTRLADKVDHLVLYRETLRQKAASARAYAKEVSKKADRVEERVAWLDRYVLAQLERSGRERMEGDLHTIRRQRNNPSVIVEVLPANLPEAFVRVIPEQREADKVALLAALKNGEEIEGARLAPVTYHLRVS